MRADVRAFWKPKAGNASSEYEDAFWPKVDLEHTGSELRLAVADGATESSFAKQWAMLLVGWFGLGHIPASFPPGEINKLRPAWRRSLRSRSHPLPWYAEEKLQLGAFAAIVGLRLRNDAQLAECGVWEATSVGDACFLQSRKHDVIAAGPLTSSDQFNQRPVLIGSLPGVDERWATGVDRAEGSWRVGDVFYLLTDAVAHWVFRRRECDKCPLPQLGEIESQGEFDTLIDDARRAGADDGSGMKNDDVTVVRCRIRSA